MAATVPHALDHLVTQHSSLSSALLARDRSVRTRFAYSRAGINHACREHVAV
jgi:hypothetical protein